MKWVMKKMPVENVILYGGGAQGWIWGQIIADVLGVNIQKPNHLEEGALIGAAILGGIGVGIYKDYDVNDRFISIEDAHIPDKKNRELYQDTQGIFEKSYKSLLDIFEELSATRE